MYSTQTTPVKRRGIAALKVICALSALALLASLTKAAIEVIGHVPVADAGGLNQANTMPNPSAYYIPFMFTGLGSNYTLQSVQLLLSGDEDLGNVSVLATETLGNDFTVPTALTTFSTSGTLNGTATAYTFTADSFTDLAEATTYYLRVSYTGANTVNWVNNSVASTGSGSGEPTGSGSGSGEPTGSGSSGVTLTPITSEVLSYTRQTISISSGNTNALNDYTAAGLSITATSIPEPMTFAGAVGGLTLIAGLFVRLRRRRSQV